MFVNLPLSIARAAPVRRFTRQIHAPSVGNGKPVSWLT